MKERRNNQLCKCLDCVYYMTCDPDDKSENLYGEICDEFEFLDENYLDDESMWQEMSYNVFVETGLDTEEDEEENYERFVDRMVNSEDFKNREFLQNIYSDKH